MARNRRQATHHGYVVIDKPAGWTSHDVVARARRIVGERRVGHAGTLDPAATGVLPLAVGLATRTVEYLADADKSYRATIRFGVTTDSADADGDVVATADVSHLTMDVLRPAIDSFTGEIMQKPPMHSAIKVDGKRLYELARAGVVADVKARPITVHEVTVIDWTMPDLTLDITCSKGTYIRSIARDLGQAVGTGAHLAGLVRTRSGPFTLDDAMSLEELQERLEREGWEGVALPPDAVLDGLTAIRLDDESAVAWNQGKRLAGVDVDGSPGPVRAYDTDDRWLGVGELDQDGSIRPVKVISVE
jgi:tRNA pseudouridine55 synthase